MVTAGAENATGMNTGRQNRRRRSRVNAHRPLEEFPSMMELGRHLIVDCWGCDQPADNAVELRRVMVEAVAAMGASLLSLNVHCFQPRGMTACAALSESHLAVHTWPEHGYVAIDAFTCGSDIDPEAGVAVLRQFFSPRETSARCVARGPGAISRPSPPPVLDCSRQADYGCSRKS